jgi:hypothetical protein
MPAQQHNVPARYTGPRSVILSAAGGPYLDGRGNQRSSRLLYPGQTLYVPASRAYGETLKYRVRREGQPQWLGYGRLVLPEDLAAAQAPDARGKAPDAAEVAARLDAAGYEFVAPHPHWEPLMTLEQAAPLLALAADASREPTVAEFRSLLEATSAMPPDEEAPAPPPAAATPPAAPATDAPASDTPRAKKAGPA